MSFKGITYEYKQSDEYKEWFKAIKADYPDMPPYLVDLSIMHHKMEPRAYQNEYKLKKEALNKPVCIPRNYIIDDAVKIYNSEEDLPEPVYVKEVEY